MMPIDQLDNPATAYWHRELPLDAEPIGVYTLEATSSRVPAPGRRRWVQPFEDIMTQ